MRQLEQVAIQHPFALSHISIDLNRNNEAEQPPVVGGTPTEERLDQIAHQLSGDQEPVDLSSKHHYERVLPPLNNNTAIPETVVARIVREVIQTLAERNSSVSTEFITNAVFDSITTIADHGVNWPDDQSLNSSATYPRILPDESHELFSSEYVELDELFPSSMNPSDIGDMEIGNHF